MTRVSDVMDRAVSIVKPSSSISEVAKKMKQRSVEILAVCENGKLRGIITGEMIISEIVAANRNTQKECAASVMCSRLPQVPPGTEITEAARLMAKHSISILPVVQSGKLMGILRMDNLLAESPALAFMVMAKKARQDSRQASVSNFDHKRLAASAA